MKTEVKTITYTKLLGTYVLGFQEDGHTHGRNDEPAIRRIGISL
jgi:hypothetical protein